MTSAPTCWATSGSPLCSQASRAGRCAIAVGPATTRALGHQPAVPLLVGPLAGHGEVGPRLCQGDDQAVDVAAQRPRGPRAPRSRQRAHEAPRPVSLLSRAPGPGTRIPALTAFLADVPATERTPSAGGHVAPAARPGRSQHPAGEPGPCPSGPARYGEGDAAGAGGMGWGVGGGRRAAPGARPIPSRPPAGRCRAPASSARCAWHSRSGCRCAGRSAPGRSPARPAAGTCGTSALAAAGPCRWARAWPALGRPVNTCASAPLQRGCRTRPGRRSTRTPVSGSGRSPRWCPPAAWMYMGSIVQQAAAERERDQVAPGDHRRAALAEQRQLLGRGRVGLEVVLHLLRARGSRWPAAAAGA